MESTDAEMIDQMSEHPVEAPVPITPQRKRPYRASMQEKSYDESVIELHDMSLLPDLSPRTAYLISIMNNDCKTMGQIEKSSAEYAIRSAQLLRSEVFLKEVLAKNTKYKSLIEKHSKLVEQRKILDLSDYHRLNYNQMRIIVRELVKEKNHSKPKKDHIKNPLIGKSSKEVLECLLAEEQEEHTYQTAVVASSHGGPKPTQPLLLMLRLLRSAVTKMPGWTMRQLQFELEEYARRNDEAHTSLEEWIDAAKQDANAGSEKWGVVAQIIIKDKRIINQGDGPKHLKSEVHQIQIINSITLFQNRIFTSIDQEYDDQTGIYQPTGWSLTEQYAPTVQASTDISIRINAFQPFDKEGIVLKAEYLAAESKEKEAKEEWEQEDTAVKIAQGLREKALKIYLKAQINTRDAGKAWEKLFGTS